MGNWYSCGEVMEKRSIAEGDPSLRYVRGWGEVEDWEEGEDTLDARRTDGALEEARSAASASRRRPGIVRWW